MKMRQFKRTKLAMMSYALFGPWGPIAQWLTRPVTPMVEAFREGMRQQAIADIQGLADAMAMPLLSQEFPGGPVVVHEEPEGPYVVKRVKDGEVVLETNSIEEATALLDKHHRQKKAKLNVFRNGEPVLFVDGVPA